MHYEKISNKYIVWFFSMAYTLCSFILFLHKRGELTINILFFKSIMIVVGSFSAAFLLVSYFKVIKTDYFKEGIIVGSTWFGINILLDLLVLIPMSGMSIADYFTQIGIMYLAIPAMSIAVGTSLENKK